MRDVGFWLSAIGLGDYCKAFLQNQITGMAWLCATALWRHWTRACAGEVLLEMGPDDLDYMKITALGHRKVLAASALGVQHACSPPPARLRYFRSCCERLTRCGLPWRADRPRVRAGSALPTQPPLPRRCARVGSPSSAAPVRTDLAERP